MTDTSLTNGADTPAATAAATAASKRTKHIRVEADAETRKVSVSYRDGDDDSGKPVFTNGHDIILDGIDGTTLTRLALLGLGTAIQRRISEDDTMAERMASVEGLVTDIRSGEWQPGRVYDVEPTYSNTVRAIQAVYSKEGVERTLDDLQALWDSKSRTEKAHIARDPRVASERMRIEEEKRKARLVIVKKDMKSLAEPFALL